uniref:Uncharacterized protein n=1 Tax=Rhizophora mucronata TaxID=61149 RepID=A0A2P2NAE5_RHIMU
MYVYVSAAVRSLTRESFLAI